LLSGCATGEAVGDRVNPEVPLWFTHRGGAMQVVFRRELTVEGRTIGEQYERGRPELDVRRGRLFVGSSDKGLYALRASSGSTIWRFETLSFVQCEPLYDPERDIVYFGSHDGALYAVKALNGALLWRFQTNAEISRRPVLRGETIYFANGADTLFAADRRTGAPKWQVHRQSALGMEIAGYAGPTVDGDRVFMAYSDGHVVAYDANDGAEKWAPVDLAAEAEQQGSGETPKYLDVDTTPIVDFVDASATDKQDESTAGTRERTRAVFVASYAGGVVALDAATGSRVWGNDEAKGVTELMLWDEPAHTPSAGGPYAGGPQVPAKKVLLAASSSTGLWGLDAHTGRELWRIKVPEGGITAPARVAGAVMFGTSRYGLYLLSPVNGRIIDAFDYGTGFATTPAAYGNRAFALSNAGALLGIQVDPPSLRARATDSTSFFGRDTFARPGRHGSP
jgi:outer membrane protein assembly factor BamB